ncbi:MAG: hypothetical protein AB8H86_24015 [Polyangiales bacterium]
MSDTLGSVNPSSPESIIASARALAAMGSHHEAECMLRGALARQPAHGPFRLALMGLSVDAAAGSWPALSILQVEQWIRDGMLVEALAALSGCSFGEDGQRWALFLGELLAPPPDAGHDHHAVHQSLLRGGASVAMATLEDMSRAATLSPWAQRRLQLLRWMLIDNAQSATCDSQVDVRASALAKALFDPLEARDLTGMAKAARSVEHPDAESTAQALDRLAKEAQTQGDAASADKRTVQHIGRAAAAMQLHMTSFESARAVYEQMLTKAAEPEVAQLLVAVQGVERVLIGRPFTQRSLSVPKPGRFEDVTAPNPEQRALASAPSAIGGTREGLGFDDVTRVAASAEIPLAAFGDEETRSIALPVSESETDSQGAADSRPPPERTFGDDVTTTRAPIATRGRDVGFDDVTTTRPPISTPASPTFVTEDTQDALLATMDGPTIPDAHPPSPAHVTIVKNTTAPLGVITEDDLAQKEPALERPNRNSVIVAAIVSVGAEEPK